MSIGDDTDKVGSVLVVGARIRGMQVSLDLANAGFKVYLVEKGPTIGGVMAQLDKTFPANGCTMCALAPRIADCGRNRDIKKLTYSEVVGVERRTQGNPRGKKDLRPQPRELHTNLDTAGRSSGERPFSGLFNRASLSRILFFRTKMT